MRLREADGEVVHVLHGLGGGGSQGERGGGELGGDVGLAEGADVRGSQGRRPDAGECEDVFNHPAGERQRKYISKKIH